MCEKCERIKAELYDFAEALDQHKKFSFAVSDKLKIISNSLNIINQAYDEIASLHLEINKKRILYHNVNISGRKEQSCESK